MGFALASAVLAASELGGYKGAAAPAGAPQRQPERRQAVRLVSAPVRIADAATVALLRPGDRVDVIATVDGEAAEVVARDVRVAQVPRGSGVGRPSSAGAEEATGGDGALVVLSVGRDTAKTLVGAGATGPLAVAVTHAG